MHAIYTLSRQHVTDGDGHCSHCKTLYYRLKQLKFVPNGLAPPFFFLKLAMLAELLTMVRVRDFVFRISELPGQRCRR